MVFFYVNARCAKAPISSGKKLDELSPEFYGLLVNDKI
jgi:hypothetical protein